MQIASFFIIQEMWEKSSCFSSFFTVYFCYFRRHGEFVEYYIYVTFRFFSLQRGKKRVY